MTRQALVFGGTGTVGSEVVRALAAAGVQSTFTWHKSEDKAKTLATEMGLRAIQVDLGDAAAVRALVEGLDPAPEVFVHCAATLCDDWNALLAVNCRAAFEAARALSARLAAGGDFVFVGALDRTQSLPLPPAFAASQGALSALTMALAKELGPRKARVNMVALGMLDGGLSRELSPKLRADYQSFSALRRVGKATEAARAIAWLALENTFMTGKVLSVNGGI